MNESNKPNVSVVPNVMVVPIPSDSAKEIAALPGDFAMLVYKKLWPDLQIQYKMLSRKQMQEYLQYLVCMLCNKPCAGLCEGKSSGR